MRATLAAAVIAALLSGACGDGMDGPGSGGASPDASAPGGSGGSGASSSSGDIDAGPPPPCNPVVVPTGPVFVDRTAELGIDFVRHQTQGFCGMADIVGGGACVFDFDGDGDLDLYFTDRAPYANRLYRNDGGKFTDVTEASGAGSIADTMGCLAFDFDGDGDLDLYLANTGPDQILRNDGGKFTDVTAEVGLVEDGFSSSVTAADMDGDGDLDLAVGKFVDPAGCPPECSPDPSKCPYQRPLLFENQGGHFVEVGVSRGITAKDPTLAILFVDFDGDGDVDLYVGNDVGKAAPDRMYINDGTGHFMDLGEQLGLASDAVGYHGDTMGVSVGDYDRDGILDLVSTNQAGQPTLLFHCHTGHVCVDSHTEGKDLDSSIPYLNWGVGFVDFDNDGWLDIFTASGRLDPPAEQRNQLYFNHFANFVEYVPQPGEALAAGNVDRGAIFGDLDGDGDVDVIAVSGAGAPQVLVNQTSWGHWLGVELDTLSAGALVTVVADGQTSIAPAVVGGSYLGSSDPRVWFGLGEACSADVTVKWLGGKKRTLKAVPANQVVHVARAP